MVSSCNKTHTNLRLPPIFAKLPTSKASSSVCCHNRFGTKKHATFLLFCFSATSLLQLMTYTPNSLQFPFPPCSFNNHLHICKYCHLDSVVLHPHNRGGNNYPGWKTVTDKLGLSLLGGKLAKIVISDCCKGLHIYI